VTPQSSTLPAAGASRPTERYGGETPPLPPPVVVVTVLVVVVGSAVVVVVLDSVLSVLVVGSVEVVDAVVGTFVLEVPSPPLSLAITTTATIRPTMIANSAATR
jgi:hypothetical protein